MTAPDTPPDRLETDTDVGIELLLSRLLRTGVIVSAAVLGIGLAVLFARDPSGTLSDPAALRTLIDPGASFPHTLTHVLAGLRRLAGESILAAAVLILIATPVLLMAVSILGFFRRRDWPYVAFTCYVLAMLILSFLVGKAG